MTNEQFETLMGKMDHLIGAVDTVGKLLAELSADLTCDNKNDGYRLPELLFTMTRLLKDET